MMGFLQISCSVKSETVISELFCILLRYSPFGPSCALNILSVDVFVASCLGHLENIGSLSYA